MTVRPLPCRWFELLVTREQLAHAIELLSQSRAVQLEARSESARGAALPELGPGLDEYREAARRFGAFWPDPVIEAGNASREPRRILDDALRALQEWIHVARPLVEELQRQQSVLEDLRHLLELLESTRTPLPRLALLHRAGPVLGGAVFRLEPQALPDALPAGIVLQRVAVGGTLYLVALGSAAALEAFAAQLIALKARRIALPEALPEGRSDREGLCALIEAGEQRLATLRASLQEANTALRMARVSGDLAFVEWFAAHVPTMPSTEHFAWVTGWTCDASGEQLRAPLDRAGVPYLLHFPQPPEGAEPPVTLRNPAWIRPFELFARLIGTPGATEADPSPIVAVIAPLVFGIMFADVGQGAVLLAAGIALRRRHPLLALLVPGGIASMICGALFGSVFAREDLLEPLWLEPLEQPLSVLAATLGLGAAVILLGLTLEALEHRWAGAGRRWLAARAGLTVCYATALLAWWEPPLAWLAAAGALWYTVGAGALAPAGARLRSVGAAAGELLETLLQMAVNTLSFLRVGAFALAHAGLSAAIVALASIPASRAAQLAALVLGNLLVIVLEALVAGIQTTRLVLFEFFVRFLRGLGREFRPLPEIRFTGHQP